MQTQNSSSSYWIAGKTRRERIALALATMWFCVGLLWALVNNLSYGREGADAGDRVNTNGLFPTTTVLAVYFSFAAATVFCVLLFGAFRFLDRSNNSAG